MLVAIAVGAGGAAFGASIAYNYIGGSFDPANPNAISKPSTTTNHQVSATITNSKVTAGQNVSVEASFGPPPELPGSNDSLDFGYTSVTIPVNINSMLASVTVGGAGADGFALGGSVNLNFLRESVDASISSDTPADGQVTAGGVVTASATDSSTLGAFAGALAISPTAGAVGAAISTNDVANTIAAGISGATVTGASVFVISGESATIINITVGGSGAADFAVGGSVSVNLIANNVSASISGGADVTSTFGAVAVTASDTATIQSFSGQGSFAASGVGAGVAVGFNDVTDTVSAYVSGASTSVTASEGNVLIQAESTPTIMTFTGGIAIGTVAGLAGSVSIDLMGCDTEAHIDAATVTAQQSVYLLAETNDTVLTYAGTISGSGGVGVGGAVAVNDLANTTKARIDDGATVVSQGLEYATIGVPQWAKDANGTESTQQVEGVIVIATDTETLGDLAITGAVGGTAGIGLNIEVDVFNDTTDAHIADSTVTSGLASGGAVIVRAHRSTGITSAGGVLGAGQVGVGAVVAADIDTSTTIASINAATVSAGTGGVEVSALARETVGTTTVGLGVGLYAGVAGGGSAADVTTTTEAYITGGSTVDSDGNLTVLANSGVTVTPSDGVGGGGIFGGGAGIAVGLIGQTTLAQIDGSTTNAMGATDVEADSNETVNSTAIAGGVGAVGVAGAIAVVNLSSATSATIVDSNVNQNTSYYYSARLALINFTKSTNLISHQWFREDRAWMFKRSEI